MFYFQPVRNEFFEHIRLVRLECLGDKHSVLAFCLCLVKLPLFCIVFTLQVCLVNDTRPSNPFGDAYTVDCLGNVVGGIPTVYNNQPMEVLMQSIVDSIKANEVCS